MGVFVGLDIGGTKLLVAAGDDAGVVQKVVRQATPDGLDEGLALLDEMIDQVLGGQKPSGIGIAIGGPLDWRRGVVSPLHQPQWRNVPLADHLTATWHCPVRLDVDTNIAAMGEYAAGGYKERRFLYLTLSTGMGGGYLIDGEIYRGSNEGHPEVGHQAVHYRCSHPERVRCECGAADCLEALVSGNGIRRIYGRPAEELDDGQWAEVAWNLGQGLRNLAVIYLPDIIVLGGGIAHGAGERLIAPARQVMQAHLRLVRPPEVRVSCLGYDTALAGALWAARSAQW